MEGLALIVDLDNKKVRVQKNNRLVEYDILFTFDSTDTKKFYIGYTNHTFSEDGRKKIYLSAYNPMKLGTELENITDENEIKMVRDVLNDINKAAND